MAREGSISRAAAAVGMAQPAVSNRIRNLEAELGRALFRRGRRGMQLTPDGERFLSYVQRSLELLQEGRESVAAAERQPIRIGLSVWAESFVLPAIDRYVRAEQGRVTVTLGRPHDLVLWLIDGKVDVACLVPVPLQSGLSAEPIAQGRVICAASPEHPLRQCGALGLADLAVQPLAMSYWGDDYDAVLARLEQAGGGRLTRMAMVPPNMARTLAADCGYITFLPDALIAGDLGRLAALSVGDLPPIPWRVDAVFRKRKQHAPEIKAFLRYLLPAGAVHMP